MNEGYEYVIKKTREITNGLLRSLIQIPRTGNRDIDVISIINQEKTKGTTSDGQNVDVVPKGNPGSREVGYKINDKTYLVSREPLKTIYIDSSVKRPWFILGCYNAGLTSIIDGSPSPNPPLAGDPEFNLVDGTTFQRYRIPKESLSTLYTLLPFPNLSHDGAWYAAVSQDLTCIAIVRIYFTSRSTPPPHSYRDTQAYWAIIKNFTLDANNSIISLSGATVTQGHVSYTYSGPDFVSPFIKVFTQTGRAVISFDSSSNANIDIIGTHRAEVLGGGGAGTGAKNIWRALDISGANSFSTDNTGTSGFDQFLSTIYHGIKDRRTNHLSVSGNPSTTDHMGYKDSSGTGATGSQFLGVAIPVTVGGYYFSPYGTISTSVPVTPPPRMFVIDATRYYDSYNSATDWVDTGLGVVNYRLRTTGTGSFLALRRQSQVSSQLYTFKQWTYDSSADTMILGRNTTVNLPNESGTPFKVLGLAGPLSGHFMVDWLLR